MAENKNDLIWRKSRSCASAACVEVAHDEVTFLVRDSVEPDGARLVFHHADWSLFITALRTDGSGLNGVER